MKPLVQLLLASLLLTSCSKTEKGDSLFDPDNTKKSFPASTTGSNSILDYYNFSSAPNNGSFALYGFTTGNSVTTPETANTNTDTLTFLTPLTANGAFYDQKGDVRQGGTVLFAGLTLQSGLSGGNTYFVDTVASRTGIGSAMSASGYIDYSVFHGKKIPVTLNPDYGVANSPTRGATDSLYIPLTIRFNKTATPFYTDSMGSSILAVYSKNYNTPIQWNADPQNTNGVVIIIEYDPEFKLNTDYWAPQTPPEKRHLYAAIRVPDNGQYAFTPEDLQGLPTNCMAKLFIGRAVHKQLNDKSGTGTYAVYAATTLVTLCRISQCGASAPTPCTVQ